MKNKILKFLTLAFTVTAASFIATACSGGKPAHVHAYTQTEVVSPTCTSEGYTKHICSCGEFTTDNVVPSTVHKLDEDRNCTTCTKKVSEGLRVVNGSLKSLYNCTDTEIIVPAGITDINSSAFKNKTQVTAIYIPKTVTLIGKEAFSGCTSLKKVIFEEGSQLESLGAKVFKDCTSLEYYELNGGLYLGNGASALVLMGAKETNVTSFAIADGCRVVYEKALSGIQTLEGVSIPSSVKFLGESVFYNSTNLKSATYAGNYNEWATITFGDSYSNPSYYAPKFVADGESIANLTLSVETINDYAFANCQEISVLTLEDTVKHVGAAAFTGCTKLMELKIGTGLESIGNKAFELCSKLFEIRNDSQLSLTAGDTANGYVAENAKNIYSSSSGSTKYTKNGDFTLFVLDGTKVIIDYAGTDKEVTLPTSVSKVGPYALYANTNITKLNIPDSITEIGDYAFYGLTGITEINLPNGLKKIGDHSFEGCTNVTTVNFGTERKLEYIGDYAFARCANLEDVVLPDGLKKTGDYSFENCVSLTGFSMPASIEELAWQILNGCNLDYIYFRGVDFYLENVVTNEGKPATLHWLAQNTYYKTGSSYYFWWYYDCGTAFVKFPKANGEEGVYNFEQAGR